MIGLLAESDWQEQDRRNWAFSIRTSNPSETYENLRQALEDAMAPPETISPERRPWYMKN